MNDVEADLRSLEAFKEFRADAAANGIKYFLEVFNPNVDAKIAPGDIGAFVNDNLARSLSGVLKRDRPEFLKYPYNGPKALEELVAFDPGLVVGVLGGGAGTNSRHVRTALSGREVWRPRRAVRPKDQLGGKPTRHRTLHARGRRRRR